MSPTTDNFIHSLVEMSKAFEELPSVKSELENARTAANQLADDVQHREESILKLKAELEAKNETIRKVEAERDDAELRFLELDDRVGKVTKKFQAALELMDETDKAIETLHPQPEPQPEPVKEPTAETGYVADAPIPEVVHSLDPITAHTPDSQPSGASEPSVSTVSTAANPSTEGQSVADPTASSEAGDGALQGTASPTTDAQHTDGASIQAQSTTAPYAGKRWSEVHPRVWNKDEWIAGGGTEYGWQSNS